MTVNAIITLDTFEQILVIVQHVFFISAGMLSLIGSSILITLIIWNRKYRLSMVWKFMIYLSIADIGLVLYILVDAVLDLIDEFGVLLGYPPLEIQSVALKGIVYCIKDGSVAASFAWTVCIAFALMLSTWINARQVTSKTFNRWFEIVCHCLCWPFMIINGIFSTLLQISDDCHFLDVECWKFHHMYGVALLCTLEFINLILYIAILINLRRLRVSTLSGLSTSLPLELKALLKFSFYILIFFVCDTWIVIRYLDYVIFGEVAPNSWVNWGYHLIFPLRGLLNVLAYGINLSKISAFLTGQKRKLFSRGNKQHTKRQSLQDRPTFDTSPKQVNSPGLRYSLMPESEDVDGEHNSLDDSDVTPSGQSQLTTPQPYSHFENR